MNWIPLTEKKPVDWRRVLVALDTGSVVVGVRGLGGWHWDETESDADQDATATHWMPFPAHPNA